MSHGGAIPMTSPTTWAYLPSGDCTIYWQRGDKMAYIFEGKQLETYPDEPLRAEVLAVSGARRAGYIRDYSALY